MKVCLTIVRAAADGGPPHYLIVRRKKLPGEAWTWSHYLLAPSICGDGDYTEAVRIMLDWLVERQAGANFLAMVRGKDIHELPPIAGHHPHLHAFVVVLSPAEADLFPHRDWKELLWMSADEALAIDPIDQDTAYGGVSPDSRRMLTEENIALLDAIAWHMEQ